MPRRSSPDRRARSLRHRVAAATAVVSLLGAAVVSVPSPALALAGARPAGHTPSPLTHITASALAEGPLIAAKLGDGLSTATGPQTVFVQLSGSGAAAVSSTTLRATTGSSLHRRATAQVAALARISAIGKTAGSVFAAARTHDKGAAKLFQTTNGVPGVAMTVDASALKSLAARPDVVRISSIVPQTVSDASTDELTKAINTWTATNGDTGAGVTVGIIDTGIDYTHADFGGPGTTAAYQTALANSDNTLTSNWYSTLTPLAQAKIAGGFDFAGNSYDPDPTNADGSANPDYQPVPHPNPDPLDCDSHGTHVAGILAGYGENADGSTFTGDYNTLDNADIEGMKIAPGAAPNAEIYSLKVFGCQGSTDLVMEALDAALDPNGDGNFADHLDIVNLSLGSDYSTVDDPENLEIDTLAENGVLPVIAAGNNGDLTDTGGSPGNAVRALDVASTVDASQVRDALTVNAPAGDAGNVPGQFSQAYSFTTHPTPVTGNVVTLTDSNASGCSTFSSADASKVLGQVVWLSWDDDDATRACGSATRTDNAANAGAIGVILTSTLDVFDGGITGDSRIPEIQLTGDATTALQADASAGTLNVTFDGTLADSINDIDPAITDTVSAFSSRGTHGSIGVVKPDVAAPGDTIVSAGMGTGNGILIDSGTSMAAPMTAGIAALVESAHPTWTVEQVKADVMNTADHDVYSGLNQTGDIYGPARVGAGRVDALDAVNNNVLVYASDGAPNPVDEEGGVSASFGVIEAPANQESVVETRQLTIQNTGTSDAQLHLAYSAIDTQPGVSYSVSPTDPDVLAGTSQTATVTMTIIPAALRHTIDPTMAVDQVGVPRQFVSDASGRILISQTGLDDLRVPVYGAAKPASTITATAGDDATYGHGAQVTLTGSGFAEGTDPTDYNSLTSVMDLGAVSPELPACAAGDTDPDGCTFNQTTQAADIQDVGAGTASVGGSVADGWLWFGVSTYADNATIGNTTIPFVDIDTDGDGQPNYIVEVENFTSTDVPVAELYSSADGFTNPIDAAPLNFEFGDVDTNVFDNNTILIPVFASDIGVKDSDTTFPITYSVGELSAYGSPEDGDVIDQTDPIDYDVMNPAIGVQTAAYRSPDELDSNGDPIPVPLYADVNTATIPLPGVSAPNTQALVLHLDNTTGTRAQVLSLNPGPPAAPTTVGATAGPTSAVVSWTAPALTGGEPILGYDIEYSSTNGTTWTPASSAFHTKTATSETVTGLTSSSPYVFRVAAINAAGTGPYSANSPAVSIVDLTSLTGGGTLTIAYGAATTLQGTLTDTTANKPLTNAPVMLYGRVLPNGVFAPVATILTDTDGVVRWSVKPAAQWQYQWRYGGSAIHEAATASPQTVNVNQVVAIVATPTTAKHATVFKIYGTIAPSLSGQAISVQILSGTTWKTVASPKTASQKLPNGKTGIGYVAALTEAKAGTYSFRAVWTGVSGRGTGTSATVKVKLT